MDFSAAASLFNAATKVRRFWMKRYGPLRRGVQNASAALRIFVRHPKKTFATISASGGPQSLTRSQLGPTVGHLNYRSRLACMEVPPRKRSAGSAVYIHPFCFSFALLPSELLERSSKRSAPLARSCPVLLSFFASSLAVASRKPSAARSPAFDDFRSSSM